ncbi:MAG: hypothetical protein ACOCZ4_00340 [Bacteroidota bacterium]
MPNLIAAEPRDIFFVLDLSLQEIIKLDKAMSMITIDFDGNKKEEQEAKDYFIENFYPFIKKIAEQYKDVESNNQ